MKQFAIIVALPFMFATASQALAAGTKSAASVDTVTVTENTGLGTWKIVVTGTLTLVENDTFSGFSFSLTDPNAGTVAPIVTQYTQPKPGETTTFSYYTSTAEKGEWSANAKMTYLTGATPGVAAASKKFSVPTED